MKNLFKILFATLAVIFALNACDDGGRIIDEIDDLTSLTLKDVDIVDNLHLTLEYAQVAAPALTSTKYKVAAELLATSSTQSLAKLASKNGVSLSQLSKIALKDIEIEANNSNIKFSDYFTELAIQITRPGSITTLATATSIPGSSVVKFQVAEQHNESTIAGWLSDDYTVMILGYLKDGVKSVNIPVELDITGDVTFSLLKKTEK
ncbi:MAG: hypothetical protein IJL64_01060 [Bacteroidales bacterium]|nr:hypothetical protein [Bacteroidales bacterium]